MSSLTTMSFMPARIRCSGAGCLPAAAPMNALALQLLQTLSAAGSQQCSGPNQRLVFLPRSSTRLSCGQHYSAGMMQSDPLCHTPKFQTPRNGPWIRVFHEGQCSVAIWLKRPRHKASGRPFDPWGSQAGPPGPYRLDAKLDFGEVGGPRVWPPGTWDLGPGQLPGFPLPPAFQFDRALS